MAEAFLESAAEMAAAQTREPGELFEADGRGEMLFDAPRHTTNLPGCQPAAWRRLRGQQGSGVETASAGDSLSSRAIALATGLSRIAIALEYAAGGFHQLRGDQLSRFAAGNGFSTVERRCPGTSFISPASAATPSLRLLGQGTHRTPDGLFAESPFWVAKKCLMIAGHPAPQSVHR